MEKKDRARSRIIMLVRVCLHDCVCVWGRSPKNDRPRSRIIVLVRVCIHVYKCLRIGRDGSRMGVGEASPHSPPMFSFRVVVKQKSERRIQPDPAIQAAPRKVLRHDLV